MEFRILGPLQVLQDGTAVEPGSPKQRALLLNLLIHRGQVVSRDRLIEDLWAGSPPSTGLGVLQNYISQLRKALGAGVVVTRGQGYVLEVEPAAVDSVRFERLVDEARTALQNRDPAGAVDRVRRALALWRGPALADAAGEPFAQAEIARLDELRAAAEETELEAELAAGRHREVSGRFEALLAEHPLRERLWWLLMLALYRSGRQADALRAYQKARAHLREELGIDPGVDLRELEAAILRQDPALDGLLAPAPATVAPAGGPGPAPPAATVRTGPPARRRPGPLVGRLEERTALVGFLDTARVDGHGGLLLLVGEPGIGKTRLLEEARTHVEDGGGVAAFGRGFEAELGRPYGAWMDAFRSIPLPPLPDAVRANLTPLLPELSTERVDLDDPSRLYDAVVALVSHLAATAPTAVFLDDLHWLDEPSAALLHFAVRHLADRGVAFLATARSAELEDNVACRRVVQALRRDDLLVDVPVGPLPASTIADLTRPIAPDADPGRDRGPPATATRCWRWRWPGPWLGATIRCRAVSMRSSATGSAGSVSEAAKLVPWLAAFGRGGRSGGAGRMSWTGTARSCSNRSANWNATACSAPTTDGELEFAHDLVRSAAYQRLSTAPAGDGARPHRRRARRRARSRRQPGRRGRPACRCRRRQRHLRRRLRPRRPPMPAPRGLPRRPRSSSRSAGRMPGGSPPEGGCALELQLIHVLLHPGVRLREPGELGGTSPSCAPRRSVSGSTPS